MSVLLKDNKLKIHDKIYNIAFTSTDFANYLEYSRFDKEFKNTGKILSINPLLNGYYSNMIVNIFWELFIKKNAFPDIHQMLNIFLERSIDKSSYPLRENEYVLLSYDCIEVKLNSLMYKFYKTYFLLCVYLYHFLKFKENSNLSIETNFIDSLTILFNDNKHIVSILNNDKDADIKMFEYAQEEDIGDFEFPSDDAYIEIITNIINNTK